MISRTGIALIAAGAIAMAGLWTAATRAAAQVKAGASIDLSADQDKKKDKGHKKKGDQDGKKSESKKGGDKKADGHKGESKKKEGGGDKKKHDGKSFGENKKKDGGQSFGGDKKKHDGKSFSGDKKDRKVTAKRMRGLSRGHGEFAVRGRNFSTWRGDRYRVRHHDRWATFVPLSALAAILIGEQRYYPYAYLSAPQDYCEGETEDGCELRWREVETIEGDVIGQCVAYCPWQD